MRRVVWVRGGGAPLAVTLHVVNQTPTPTATAPICPTGFAQGVQPLSGTATPCPTFTPSSTPTPTFTSTASPMTWHVNCSIPFVNVRNFPAGQTAPVPQIDGRVMFTLLSGTVVNVFELRPARDGVLWARITPYEGLNQNDTLWIRTRNADNVTETLVQGMPTACAGQTANLLQPTQIPPTPAFPIGVPGCLVGRDCPHTNPLISDVDLVSFILACEAGAEAGTTNIEKLQDAIANAHVVFNRMDSGLYAGNARAVISQSGQWQPYSEGCNNTLGLNNPQFVSAVIRQAAQQLVAGTEPAPTFKPEIDYLGLYTFGVFNANPLATPGPSVAELLAPSCPDGATQAMQVFIAIASFGNGVRSFASVFFSDGPGCVFN